MIFDKYRKMTIVDFYKKVLRLKSPITNIDPVRNGPLKGTLRFDDIVGAIYIPDGTTIDEYFIEMMNNEAGRYSVEIIEARMKEENILTEENKLDAIQNIIFFLLHEEGHYEYFQCFLRNGLTPETFHNAYVTSNKPWLKQLNDLFPNYIEGADSSIDSKYRFASCSLYRKNTFEQMADSYALNRIKKYIKYRRFFNRY
jgi:hypothetical protein